MSRGSEWEFLHVSPRQALGTLVWGTCPWAHLITYMVSYRDHQCKIILIKTCFHRFYCFGTVVHAFKRKLLVAIIVCRDPV